MIISWIVTILLIIFARLAMQNRKVKEVAEVIIQGIYRFFENVAGEHTRRFFPLAATAFIFILIGNWSGIIPGVGSVGFYAQEHGEKTFIPFIRGATADLNTTFALGIVSVVAIHYFSFKKLGIGKYIKSHFLNPIGILEVFADFAKILSFSFRLFGNIFAGEVLLTVIAFLVPIVAPLPFLGLEIFVGFIQALVFAMLTLIFLKTAVEH